MILKAPLLVVLLYLHEETKNSLACAMVWGGCVFLISLVLEGFDAWLIPGVGISFMLAMGYFALLEYLDGSIAWWLVLLPGAFVLIMLG